MSGDLMLFVRKHTSYLVKTRTVHTPHPMTVKDCLEAQQLTSGHMKNPKMKDIRQLRPEVGKCVEVKGMEVFESRYISISHLKVTILLGKLGTARTQKYVLLHQRHLGKTPIQLFSLCRCLLDIRVRGVRETPEAGRIGKARQAQHMVRVL